MRRENVYNNDDDRMHSQRGDQDVDDSRGGHMHCIMPVVRGQKTFQEDGTRYLLRTVGEGNPRGRGENTR